MQAEGVLQKILRCVAGTKANSLLHMARMI